MVPDNKVPFAVECCMPSCNFGLPVAAPLARVWHVILTLDFEPQGMLACVHVRRRGLGDGRERCDDGYTWRIGNTSLVFESSVQSLWDGLLYPTSISNPTYCTYFLILRPVWGLPYGVYSAQEKGISFPIVSLGSSLWRLLCSGEGHFLSNRMPRYVALGLSTLVWTECLDKWMGIEGTTLRREA
jgi:hypothetical protein